MEPATFSPTGPSHSQSVPFLIDLARAEPVVREKHGRLVMAVEEFEKLAGDTVGWKCPEALNKAMRD